MKLTLISTIFAAAGIASAIPMTVPAGAFGPDPNKVFVSNITYGGTGCPDNTVAQVFNDDRTIFTLIFDAFVASVGAGISVTENRKNCQLNVNIHYPGGWQYSVFSADYRGYAGLDAGVTGQQKSTYYFSGDGRQSTTTSNFNGPLYNDYNLEDKIATTSTVWSPCGVQGLLNINSQVRVASTKQGAQGQLTTDSIDGNFQQILSFQWQKC